MTIKENIPSHIAIVMDGNGRWAQENHLSRSAGHQAGKETLRHIVQHCLKRQVRYLSVFAFSSENWRRPNEEVSALLKLFEHALTQEETNEWAKDTIQIKMIGDLSRFSFMLRQLIRRVEKNTLHNVKLRLTVAVNYGGRWDIVQAAHKMQKAGVAFTEENLNRYLSCQDLPNPDLFIRTGGEKRISNFMLWQCAYSELYFSDILWPEFTPDEFDKALSWYASRERRFGMISDQVKNS